MQINNILDLKAEISRLELKSKAQKELLANQLHETYESLKPRNILHNTVTNITKSPKLTDKVLKTAGSLAGTLAASFLPKKILFGFSAGVLKKIGGIIFDAGIKKSGTDYAHQIKNGGSGFLKRLMNRVVR